MALLFFIIFLLILIAGCVTFISSVASSEFCPKLMFLAICLFLIGGLIPNLREIRIEKDSELLTIEKTNSVLIIDSSNPRIFTEFTSFVDVEEFRKGTLIPVCKNYHSFYGNYIFSKISLEPSNISVEKTETPEVYHHKKPFNPNNKSGPEFDSDTLEKLFMFDN